ncbi:hypothetical protein BDV96DRAFT_3970 [Lophiotrema nucula]|uniref:RRM domain-containing protein n=1 Tax=Lophiotrema nucula TaxID=690887 RepID=A0A6A5ZSM1_9PLEO|nr:hypothetical protein BDV96DRAFT_3970 [Lophiotrema nucula]
MKELTHSGENEGNPLALPTWFYGNLRKWYFEDDFTTDMDATRNIATLLQSSLVMEKIHLHSEEDNGLEHLYSITMLAIREELRKSHLQGMNDIARQERRHLALFSTHFRSMLSKRGDKTDLQEDERIRVLKERMVQFERRLLYEDSDTSAEPTQPQEPKTKAMSSSIFVGNLPLQFNEPILRSFLLSLFQSKYPSCFWASIPCDNYSGEVKGFAYLHFSKDEECNRAVKEMAGVECGGKTMHIDFTETSVEIPSEAEKDGRSVGVTSVIEYSDEMPPPPKNYEVKIIDGNRTSLAVLKIRSSGITILDVGSGSEIVKAEWKDIKVKTLVPGLKTVSILQFMPHFTRGVPLIEHTIETGKDMDAKQIVYDITFWTSKEKELNVLPTMTFQVRSSPNNNGPDEILELGPTTIELKSIGGYTIFRKRWMTIAHRSQTSGDDDAYEISAQGKVVRFGKVIPYLADLEADSPNWAANIVSCVNVRIAKARSTMPEIASGSQTSGGSDDGRVLSEAESLDPYDPLFDAEIVSVDSDVTPSADEIKISHYHRHWKIPWVQCQSGDQAEEFINDVVYGGNPPEAGYILSGPSQSSGYFWTHNWEDKVRPGTEVVVLADLREDTPWPAAKRAGLPPPYPSYPDNNQDDGIKPQKSLERLSYHFRLTSEEVSSGEQLWSGDATLALADDGIILEASEYNWVTWKLSSVTSLKAPTESPKLLIFQAEVGSKPLKILLRMTTAEEAHEVYVLLEKLTDVPGNVPTETPQSDDASSPSDLAIHDSDFKIYTSTVTVTNLLPDPHEFKLTIDSQFVTLGPESQVDHRSQWFASTADCTITGEVINPEDAESTLFIRGRFFHLQKDTELGSTANPDADERVIELTQGLKQSQEISQLLKWEEDETTDSDNSSLIGTALEEPSRETMVSEDKPSSDQDQRLEQEEDSSRNLDALISTNIETLSTPLVSSHETLPTGIESLSTTTTSAQRSDEFISFGFVGVRTLEYPDLGTTTLNLRGEFLIFNLFLGKILFTATTAHIAHVKREDHLVFIDTLFRKERRTDTGVYTTRAMEQVTIEARDTEQATRIETVLRSKMERKQRESDFGADKIKVETQVETRSEGQPSGIGRTSDSTTCEVFYTYGELKATRAALFFKATTLNFVPTSNSTPGPAWMDVSYDSISNIAHSLSARMISFEATLRNWVRETGPSIKETDPIATRLKLLLDTKDECLEIFEFLSVKVAKAR